MGGCETVFEQLVGLLGQGVGQLQGLYLHRAEQHRKRRAYIHATSGIQTDSPSMKAVKTQA